MPTATLEAELVDLEKQYWQALKDNDLDTALRLTDEPCLLTGAQGVGLVDRKTLAAMMKSASYTLNRFELKNVQVRALRDDVALIAYQVHEELNVEGKPVVLDATDSSAWVRRDGRWFCAHHTESIAGDPFGRDRQKR
jgi:uncharacterized protein (TIGR02246 family)